MVQTLIDILMVLVIGGATYYDVVETVRRIGLRGPGEELNPAVQYLWKAGYQKSAILAGIVLPTGILTLVFSFLGLYQLVGFVAGVKAFNAWRLYITRKA